MTKTKQNYNDPTMLLRITSAEVFTLFKFKLSAFHVDYGLVRSSRDDSVAPSVHQIAIMNSIIRLSTFDIIIREHATRLYEN